MNSRWRVYKFNILNRIEILWISNSIELILPNFLQSRFERSFWKKIEYFESNRICYSPQDFAYTINCEDIEFLLPWTLCLCCTMQNFATIFISFQYSIFKHKYLGQLHLYWFYFTNFIGMQKLCFFFSQNILYKLFIIARCTWI